MGDDFAVEFVGFGEALSEDLLGSLEGGDGRVGGMESAEEGDGLASGDLKGKMSGGFGAFVGGGDGLGFLINDELVESVFDVGIGVGGAVEGFLVGGVFGEEPAGGFGGGGGVEVEFAEFLVVEFEVLIFLDDGWFWEVGFAGVSLVPGVAKPDGGEEVEGSRVGSVVGHGDAPDEVVVGAFGDFLDDIEEAIFVKDVGVLEFELAFLAGALGVFADELVVGESGLRVAVAGAGVGMGGGAIFVVVAFFDVFAVVALGTGEAKEAFFEDGVVGVPEGERKAQAASAVAPPLEAVLAPSVGAAAGFVVGEIIPAASVFGLIFADRSPLAFGEEGAPTSPVGGAILVFLEADFFGGHGREDNRLTGEWGN